MTGKYRDDGNTWDVQGWRSGSGAYASLGYCDGRVKAIERAFRKLREDPAASLRAICNGNKAYPVAIVHCVDRFGFVDFVPVEYVLGKDLFDYKCPQRECSYVDGKYEVKQVNDYVFELKSVA